MASPPPMPGAKMVAVWPEFPMPRKIRELNAELRASGAIVRSGRGSHTVWKHYAAGVRITMSGHAGDDAKPYQERDLQVFLEAVRKAR